MERRGRDLGLYCIDSDELPIVIAEITKKYKILSDQRQR